MARPRKNAPLPELTPGEAAYVMERLMRDRRVSRTEVNQYLSEMKREIGELEARLRRLREVTGNVVVAATGVAAAVGSAAIVRRVRGRRRGAAAGAEAAPRRGRKAGRVSAAITEEQLASRRLQGRYLALVRQFAASRRAQFARTAKEKGREAAIKEMQEALRK
jgi:hypothetical protein